MFLMIEVGKLKLELMIGWMFSFDEVLEVLMVMDCFDGVGIGVIMWF